MKVLVEPSGAASLAALLEHKGLGQGRTICLLCGGNMDLKLLADIIERGMIRQGRYLHIFTAVKDKPGGLAGLLDAVAAVGGNVMNVEHNRLASDVRYGATGVELLIETRGAEHAATITRYLIEQGYPVRPIDHVGIQ
jgi:threonine dehydratase